MNMVPRSSPHLAVLLFFQILGLGGWPGNGANAQSAPVTRIGRSDIQNVPRLQIEDPVVFHEGRSADSVSRIVSAAVDQAGSVYLLDAGHQRVQVLDGRGRELRSFTVDGKDRTSRFQPMNIAVARDTILIFGIAVTQNRPTAVIDVYRTSGTFLATSKGPVSFTSVNLKATDNGWILQYGLMNLTQPRKILEAAVDTQIIAGIAPPSARLTRILAYPMLPRILVSANRFMFQRMGFQSTAAIASDGFIYANTEDGFVIDVRPASGRVQRHIVADVDRIPYTDREMEEDVQREVKESLARGYIEDAKRTEKYGRQAGHAEFRQVLGNMIASRGGKLLVNRPDLELQLSKASGEDIWDLLDVRSGITGRLHSPARASVALFEWPYIYVSLAAPQQGRIVRYRIVNTAPRT